MKIKICGITEIETLNFLIENGVDYVGFIFHENNSSRFFQDYNIITVLSWKNISSHRFVFMIFSWKKSHHIVYIQSDMSIYTHITISWKSRIP